MPYGSTTGAMDSIRSLMNAFYATNYPEVSKTKKSNIEQAITEVQGIYSRNFFPEMGVTWRKFNDNIGHMYYPGCFRCHDGKHVNEEGKVLSRDCNVCHTLLAQTFENDPPEMSLKGVEYRHPVEVDKAWQEMNCWDCHTEKR